MNGGISSLELVGSFGLGKIGGFDDVPGLVVIEGDEGLDVVILFLIGGETCRLFSGLHSPKLFLLGLPGQLMSMSGSEMGTL
jgi:hypothetical protein